MEYISIFVPSYIGTQTKQIVEIHFRGRTEDFNSVRARQLIEAEWRIYVSVN